MENIFKNAKFGDKFRTRDGRMAIYWEFSEVAQQHRLIVSDKYISLFAYQNGQMLYEGTTNSDIISKCKEPINKEELEKEASEYALKVYNEQSDNLKIEIASNVLLKNNVTKAYIDGFTRGMELLCSNLCHNYEGNIWTKEE